MTNEQRVTNSIEEQMIENNRLIESIKSSIESNSLYVKSIKGNDFFTPSQKGEMLNNIEDMIEKSEITLKELIEEKYALELLLEVGDEDIQPIEVDVKIDGITKKAFLEIDSANSDGVDGHLWLTDIIKIENPTFGTNTMIYAPVGSGKSTFIEEILAKMSGKIDVLLVSNRALKDSVCPEDDNLRAAIANRMFTTGNPRIYGEGKGSIHVMTYAEFGLRISSNNDFADRRGNIFCDEIHSLIEYKSYSAKERAQAVSDGLTHTVKYLFNPHPGKQIFYFTATDARVKELASQHKGILKHVQILDYREYPGVRKYIDKFVAKISDTYQICGLLKEAKEFIDYGYKALAYCKRIGQMKVLEDIARKAGFNPICLWSTVSTFEKMSEEQLRVREELLATNKIPEPYNFLIINDAMREGWDLKDEKVDLAIINSADETAQIQARGRVRKGISRLIIRTNDASECIIVNKVKLEDKWVNVDLTSEDKENLAIELDMKQSNGRLTKWRGLKAIIENSGYTVEDKVRKVNGKQIRISIITKK